MRASGNRLRSVTKLLFCQNLTRMRLLRKRRRGAEPGVFITS